MSTAIIALMLWLSMSFWPTPFGPRQVQLEFGGVCGNPFDGEHGCGLHDVYPPEPTECRKVYCRECKTPQCDCTYTRCRSLKKWALSDSGAEGWQPREVMRP